MIPKVVHFCFPEIIDVNLPKCRDSPRTSNVEILHISKHFDFPQKFKIFLRESLESLLDFKSVDIQSIDPTFVCIWVLHSHPLRYLSIALFLTKNRTNKLFPGTTKQQTPKTNFLASTASILFHFQWELPRYSLFASDLKTTSHSANSATRQTRPFGVLEVQIAKLGRPSLAIALCSVFSQNIIKMMLFNTLLALSINCSLFLKKRSAFCW